MKQRPQRWHWTTANHSPVPPAVYGYMFACTSKPVARAESIFAIIARALLQFRVPAAFR